MQIRKLISQSEKNRRHRTSIQGTAGTAAGGVGAAGGDLEKGKSDKKKDRKNSSASSNHAKMATHRHNPNPISGEPDEMLEDVDYHKEGIENKAAIIEEDENPQQSIEMQQHRPGANGPGRSSWLLRAHNQSFSFWVL